jgi:hypothetical protein
MAYRAVINFDIEGGGGGEFGPRREQLYKALRHLGWRKAKTSALVVETDDINMIWKGLVAFMKAQPTLGTSLSALTFNVQRVEADAGEAEEAALNTLMGGRFPWEPPAQ